jgi:hypothetical protein
VDYFPIPVALLKRPLDVSSLVIFVCPTLCSKKKTAFGEDFSCGVMPKKRPRLEGEENKGYGEDNKEVDEEGGGSYYE